MRLGGWIADLVAAGADKGQGRINPLAHARGHWEGNEAIHSLTLAATGKERLFAGAYFRWWGGT